MNYPKMAKFPAEMAKFPADDPRHLAFQLRLRAVQRQQGDLKRAWEEIVKQLKNAADDGKFEIKVSTIEVVQHKGLFDEARRHGIKVTGEESEEATLSFEEPVE